MSRFSMGREAISDKRIVITSSPTSSSPSWRFPIAFNEIVAKIKTFPTISGPSSSQQVFLSKDTNSLFEIAFQEAEILKDRPSRNGVKLPVESSDFKSKSAIFLPEEARYDYLLNLPSEKNLGEAVDKAMELIEKECPDLSGILPKNYKTIFKNDLLKDLLRLFNNDALNEIKDDVIGRIYEYFLNKFAKNIAKHIVKAREDI